MEMQGFRAGLLFQSTAQPRKLGLGNCSSADFWCLHACIITLVYVVEHFLDFVYMLVFQ